jgi:hypothetical protein
MKIIKIGLAYADDTEQAQVGSHRLPYVACGLTKLQMREERGQGIASRRRDATVEENLSRFEEMTKGTQDGVRWCLRAKMSVDNPNKAMRDPVIYRCNLDPHHRTGYALIQFSAFLLTSITLQIKMEGLPYLRLCMPCCGLVGRCHPCPPYERVPRS